MSRSDGRGDLPNAYRHEEHERRIDHMLRVGKVVEVDYARVSANGKTQPRVRVQLDGEPSAWLPISSPRNGPNGEWDAYELDEQVLVWAPSGTTAGAFVWGSIPRDAFPPKSIDPDDHLRWYFDDTTFLYNRARHAYEVVNPNSDGHHWFHITENSEVHQDNDLIRLRIAQTFLEVRDGSITLSVNGGTSVTITDGLVNVLASLTNLVGALNVTELATALDMIATATGVTLATHIHEGVEPGPSVTTPAVPGT